MNEQTTTIEKQSVITPAIIAGVLAGHPASVRKVIDRCSELHLTADAHRRRVREITSMLRGEGQAWADIANAIYRVETAPSEALDALAGFETLHGGPGDGFLTVLIEEETRRSLRVDEVDALRMEAEVERRAAETASDVAEKFEGVLRALGIGKLIDAARKPIPRPAVIVVPGNPEPIEEPKASASEKPRREVVTIPAGQRADGGRPPHVELLKRHRGTDVVVLTRIGSPDDCAVALKSVEAGKWQIVDGLGGATIGQVVDLPDLINGLGAETLFHYGRKIGANPETVRAACQIANARRREAHRAPEPEPADRHRPERLLARQDFKGQLAAKAAELGLAPTR